MKIQINKNTIGLMVITLIVGITLGYIISPSPQSKHKDEHNHETTSLNQIWTCSMHPQIRKPEAGSCPICGMDLIPLDEGTGDENPLEVKMSASAMKLANIQTAIITRKTAIKEVRMTGKVQVDERNVSTQTSHISGRIERLNVNYTGDYVRKGQVLANVYAPELVTAQEELFEAYKSKDTDPSLYAAARGKLINWKLTEKQIDNIIAAQTPIDNFPILSDLSGVVLKKNINLGDHVKRGTSLLEVADLSSVWVLFDVYESDMPWVKTGDHVEFYIQSLPGQLFEGTISFIDPVINPNTRVAKARVNLRNTNGRLKPEMFADGTVHSTINSKSDDIVIPKSAVMWTGKRSIVYVKNTTANGISFMMREVRLGPGLGDGYVVESGLVDGDEVAVNGTFSIDAAAQLAGKPSMMNPMKDEKQVVEYVEIGISAKTALSPIFDAYINLKNALVNDNFEKAQSASKKLSEQLESTKMSLFQDKAHMVWMNHSKLLLASSNRISSSKNVGQARKEFQAISSSMITLAKSFDPLEKTIYVQFCPMADNNNGAHWLSMKEEVLNPYFGDKMLRCGNIEEEIK